VHFILTQDVDFSRFTTRGLMVVAMHNCAFCHMGDFWQPLAP